MSNQIITLGIILTKYLTIPILVIAVIYKVARYKDKGGEGNFK